MDKKADLRVNNVDNTVGDKNVRNNDAGTVNEDLSVGNGDGQVGAVGSLERSSVLQSAAVADSAGDDVVSEDAGYLLSGEVGKTGTDGLESGVVGREDGDILGGVDGIDKFSCTKSTGERSQSSGKSGLGSGLGDSKDSVDDVDHTTGEVDILTIVSDGTIVLVLNILTAVVTVEFARSPLKIDTPPLAFFALMT